MTCLFRIEAEYTDNDLGSFDNLLMINGVFNVFGGGGGGCGSGGGSGSGNCRYHSRNSGNCRYGSRDSGIGCGGLGC